MPYVVTRLCIDCLDRGCVEECPVECIYELREPTDNSLPRMAYIHPTECINCGACEPECPVDAIFEEDEVPDKWRHYVELNAQYSSKWPGISAKKAPLPTSDAFKDKTDKGGLLSPDPAE